MEGRANINYASLLDSEPQTSEDILSQSIWFNSKIQVNNRYVFLQRWCNNGVFYINDLLNSNDAIMSFTEFKNTYNVNSTFTEFYGIISAIPSEWKESIKNTKKL